MSLPAYLLPQDRFASRHIGPSEADVDAMLAELGFDSLSALSDAAVPRGIRLGRALALPSARTEQEALADLRRIFAKNQVLRSHLGMGYSDCIVPPVIQRNILENPGWYTQYTPYQAEISQGRMEALINFQTMCADLTGLPLANASLLDEGTAAAEAMTMARALVKGERARFAVDPAVHPQTLEVVRTRALPVGIVVEVVSADDVRVGPDLIGVLVQSPDTFGVLRETTALSERLHAAGALLVVATDLLACVIATPPGDMGADIAIGSSQRFGVPMGYGGPHAAFMATREDYVRKMPGRIIGVSKDAHGKPAYRLTLQTREQHIRRDKATSNICTAQVLLAVMAGMYAVWHGPDGLRAIATRVHGYTDLLARGLRAGGVAVTADFFDTITLSGVDADAIVRLAEQRGRNLRFLDAHRVGIALDETTTLSDVDDLLGIVGEVLGGRAAGAGSLAAAEAPGLGRFARTSDFLSHPVFHRYHAEHEMLRYIKRLEGRDLSLTHSMIPLGSCTMKLNATAEMQPVTWREVSSMHPFAPLHQARGYGELFAQLEAWLGEITGMDATSLQPNAGSQGEYAGLLAIRAYHEARAEKRNVCLIPVSAHGTNPASAAVAGFDVVVVACDERGNVDLADLRAKASEHASDLGALMITYPSTHGVFEEAVREVCAVVHAHGGLVYLDGANMNAQVGLCRPGDFGADVCHLNLHKTFCIPHGGGGPGMGPICVKKHLAPHLPGHGSVGLSHGGAVGPVSAAPWGSASILPIPWMYIAMMGPDGLTRATQVAILNANYMARRLGNAYDIVYSGHEGLVAHEFILDLRGFKASAGITPDDVAKRLMDYGFHAPTMSFPVAGTLMVEPTESEARGELDRLVDALLMIRDEIRAIEGGRADREDNALKRAPHTAADVTKSEWTHAYSREQAAFPAEWVRDGKFWPSVGRVDNVYGDRNIFCVCVPMDEWER